MPGHTVECHSGHSGISSMPINHLEVYIATYMWTVLLIHVQCMYILVRMHVHVHVNVYKHMYGVYKLVLTMYMSCTNVVEI